MPIYEYECPVCGRVEVIQKATDKVLTECPVCKEKGKKSKISKAISASSFQLKGSGWYKTDYTPSKGSSSTESSSSSSESTPAKGSSDTKESSPKKGCGSNCACH